MHLKLSTDMCGKGCCHLYTTEQQYNRTTLALRMMKHRLNTSGVVLHTDFAENYNCQLASEVQSYHCGMSRNHM